MGREGSTRASQKPSVVENLSIKNSHVEDLAHVLVQQLNGKGDRAYIYFYKVLKCKDFDGDGKVFEREFEKTLEESRLSFSRAQVLRLFEQFAIDKKGLSVVDFKTLICWSLVFRHTKAQLVMDLYSRLLASQSTSSNLTYDQVVSTFRR